MTAPQHGDRRNRRWVWHESPPASYVTATGEPFTIRSGGSGEDREEFYCQVHGWIDYGFLGLMLFPAEHGGCVS